MIVPVMASVIIHGNRLTAYDESGSYVRGRWTRTRGDNYTFGGSFQPATDKDLRILPEGDITEGAKSLQTRRELFITDTSLPSRQEARQTFIIFEDEVWRVRRLADWSSHSNLKRYVCIKFFEANQNTLSATLETSSTLTGDL